MKKIKEEKGITLVALIITIVVLLILAAVAMGAVKDSDIIGYAKNAAGSFNQSKANEVDDLAKYEAELKKYAGDNGVVPDELSKYILGANGEGRDLNEIVDFTSGELKQDPADETSTVHEKVKIAYLDIESSTEDFMAMCIRYNRDVYKFDFSVNATTGLPEESLKGTLTLVNTPEGNLGKYVTYANNTWIVLRDDASGVELISANGLGELKFESTTFEDGRTQYNNAVEIIVKACKTATGITSNIRSVGGPAEDTTTMNDTVVFNKVETFQPSEGVTFENYEGSSNGFKVGDTNYLSDYLQMLNLGILATDDPCSYWLASRVVGVYDRRQVIFRINNVNFTWLNFYTAAETNDGLNIVHCNGVVLDELRETEVRSVRPVVTLEAGVLDGAMQTGLRNDPIVLNK